MPTDLRIEIESEFSPSGELATLLQTAIPANVAAVTVEQRDAAFRLEPSIVIALIAAGGNTLVALVAGLLATRKGGKSTVVRIEKADGTKIEFPGEWTPAQIKEALAEVSPPTVQRIRLLVA